MKIEKKEAVTAFAPAAPAFAQAKASPSTDSTLSSAAAPRSKILMFLGYVVTKVISFFSSLLFCNRKTEKPVEPIVEFTREIKESSFYEFVYDKDGAFKNKKSYEIISDFFIYAGETSLVRLLWNRSAVIEKYNKLVSMEVHCLECLYFLLSSRRLTEALENVKHKTGINKIDRETWQAMVSELAWSFIRNHIYSENPEYPWHPLDPLLPGFCEMLNLKFEPLQKLIKEKKWAEFINEAIDQRKAHFKI